ncbi:hypothetical protein LTSEMIN_4955, partial [Salmonella enterica subsp. enterica serovar Minnesota str. A4-603]
MYSLAAHSPAPDDNLAPPYSDCPDARIAAKQLKL